MCETRAARPVRLLCQEDLGEECQSQHQHCYRQYCLHEHHLLTGETLNGPGVQPGAFAFLWGMSARRSSRTSERDACPRLKGVLFLLESASIQGFRGLLG